MAENIEAEYLLKKFNDRIERLEKELKQTIQDTQPMSPLVTLETVMDVLNKTGFNIKQKKQLQGINAREKYGLWWIVSGTDYGKREDFDLWQKGDFDALKMKYANAPLSKRGRQSTDRVRERALKSV